MVDSSICADILTLGSVKRSECLTPQCDQAMGLSSLQVERDIAGPYATSHAHIESSERHSEPRDLPLSGFGGWIDEKRIIMPSIEEFCSDAAFAKDPEQAVILRKSKTAVKSSNNEQHSQPKKHK